MNHLKRCILFALFLVPVFEANATAATPSPNLLKTKQEAEAKGYAFITDHDEIVAKAKKEGQVRVVASMDSSNIKAQIAEFKKRYPFIDIHVHESQGTEAAKRLLLEIQSGTAKEWDVILVASDFRSEYIPYIWKGDILGMATHGVLRIPPLMVDRKNKNVVAVHTHFQVTVYNPALVPANVIPKTWEDILRPELKGNKFAVDIRPQEVAGLVPAWGLEKTLDFARKIAQQQPLWVRGASRTMTAMQLGEVPMMIGPNFGSFKGMQRKDPAGVLRYVVLEPVPVRFGNEQAILATSQHPNAGLLWLEWMATPEARKINDEHEYNSSVYLRGSLAEQELKGKKLSVVDWEHQHNMEKWQAQVFEAYGFPKAESRK
jgi:ABC-type Fe3+ transport system substrate-binding protein